MNVILLLSSINPQGGILNTAHPSKKESENDQKRLLNYCISQIENGVDYIVFGENSIADFCELKSWIRNKPFKDRVEFVRYQEPYDDSSFEKGNSEFRQIDYIMENSAIINSLKPEDVIWEIKKQNDLLNISQMIEVSPINFEIYCNLGDYPISWTDIYLMAWKKNAYRNYHNGKYRIILKEQNLKYTSIH
jgi:hypothetical protein